MRILNCRIYFLLIFSFTCHVVFGQTIPDFSSINISELSNTQIKSLVQRANAAGYSQEELLQLAKAQGLSIEELGLLNSKLGDYKNNRVAKSSDTPVSSSRLRKPYQDSLSQLKRHGSKVFGLDVFRVGSFLSFQTTQNLPTPRDYIIGSGDVIYIDVYGESEFYYQAEVSPDGQILLENVGPITVSGLKISDLRERLKNKLSNFYSGLVTSPPKSNLAVSLGQARSISVNVVGQVELPGTYTLSGLSTVFNALYLSGGVSENGTLRDVRVFRDSKLISTIDVYDFLTNGNNSSNVRLESNDVILVGPYGNRVELFGAVKIPGLFEIKEDENLETLLSYAGGFSDNAQTDQLKVERILNGQKVIADITRDQFAILTPKAGDKFIINEVLNRYENRVVLKGAVFRPGNYSISDGTTVSQLIKNSRSIRPDAFLDRAFIIRTNDDFTTSTLSFSLEEALSGTKDIPLMREDVINILSKNDLSEERYIEISGQVGSPGIYPYSDNLTLSDVILLAGGFSQAAMSSRIEVTRRITSEGEGGYSLSQVFLKEANLDALNKDEQAFHLEPFDNIVVRKNPNFHRQIFAHVEGQVLYPGPYAIENEGERISSVLERAGGVNQFAYVDGATLVRRTEFYDEVSDSESRIDELLKLKERINSDTATSTETETLLNERIEGEINRLSSQKISNQSLSSFTKKERLRDIVQKNDLLGDVKFSQAEAIGINLKRILSNPGSTDDLLIQEGDILLIPKKTETVRLRGKLLYPTTVQYEKGKSLRHYINAAGGFDNRAKRNGTYVVYANGRVARTRQFLFFKSYPKVEPGTEVIVPTKPLKIPFRIQDVVAVTSGLATLALVISQISNNNKN